MSKKHQTTGAATHPFGSLPWGLPPGLNPLSPGASPVPGLDEISDFMRQAWESMNLSPSLAPTLNLQELDKRIGDLKAVEQWLLLNLNMLRGSIQALEVQRATIATLRAFSEAASSPPGSVTQEAMVTASRHAAESESTRGQASPGPQPTANESMQSPRAARPARKPSKASSTSAEPMLEAAKAWWQTLNAQFEQVSQAALNASASSVKSPAKTPHAKPRSPAKQAAGGSKRKPRGSPS